MGSTGEPDRKRRHFTSVSPTAGPMAGPTPTKKKPIAPISEDKKVIAIWFIYLIAVLFHPIVIV